MGVVSRPIKTVDGGEFAEQILADLIKEGWFGEALLWEFKKRQAQIQPMLANAEDIANGKAEYETYEDVFGTEDWVMIPVQFSPQAAKYIKR